MEEELNCVLFCAIACYVLVKENYKKIENKQSRVFSPLCMVRSFVLMSYEEQHTRLKVDFSHPSCQTYCSNERFNQR